jgi:hypothetical protein
LRLVLVGGGLQDPDERLSTLAAVTVARDRRCAVGERNLVLDREDELSGCECFGDVR